MYKKLLSSIFISNYYHILGVNKLQQQGHPTSHAYKIHLSRNRLKLSPSTHLCSGLDPAAKFALAISRSYSHTPKIQKIAQTTTSEVEGRQFTEGKVTMFGNNVCLALIHVHI